MRAKVSRSLGMLAVSVVVGGCGRGSAPDSQVGAVSSLAPTVWSAAKEARSGVDNQWISRFRDSRLTALVGQAVNANPDMVVAQERVRKATILARGAQAPALPQSSLTLDGSRLQQVYTGLPIPNASSPLTSLSSTVGASLNVSWEPDIWGKVAAGQSAELARVGAEESAYRAARASLAAQVAKAWFALGEANEQLGLAEESVTNFGRIAEAVEERYAQSLDDEGGTAAQLRLSRTDVANARATVEQWKGEVARSQRQLELLAGRYPEGTAGAGGVMLPRLPAKPPKGLPSELLVRRPDVVEAERNFAAALKDSEVADLARFPSISLTGSGGSSSSELGDLLKSDYGVWSLAGNLTAPILSGGSLQADFQAAKSEERSALALLQRTVLDAFGEVEQALVADEVYDRRIAATEAALREADAADEAAARDYADGVDSILTLLEGRGQRVQIASHLVTLKQQRLSNRVDLHLALGGDFQARAK